MAPVETPAETPTLWVTHPRWEGDALIVHGMTTRHFAPPDLPREELLARIRKGLGMPQATSVLLGQNHGRKVAFASEAVVSRAENQVLTIPETDAVVTDQPQVLLHLLVADCVPILAVDRARRIVGAAHAGWRGTVKKIAAALAREMASRGANLAQTEVWLGPAIHQCCFHVGPDVLKRFTAVSNWWPAIHPSAARIDLPLVCRLQLARVGVPPDNMVTSPLCTRCQRDLLHSHRAEPQSLGRMAAVIGLRD
jgi:YfiH family protein